MTTTAGLNAPEMHQFLSAKEVIARYGWGRTKGYLMLKSEGFPRHIAGSYRLDTLLAWEARVLAGELDPQPPTEEADSAEATEPKSTKEQAATEPRADLDDEPTELPTRGRSRGLRTKAA